SSASNETDSAVCVRLVSAACRSCSRRFCQRMPSSTPIGTSAHRTPTINVVVRLWPGHRTLCIPAHPLLTPRIPVAALLAFQEHRNDGGWDGTAYRRSTNGPGARKDKRNTDAVGGRADQ